MTIVRGSARTEDRVRLLLSVEACEEISTLSIEGEGREKREREGEKERRISIYHSSHEKEGENDGSVFMCTGFCSMLYGFIEHDQSFMNHLVMHIHGCARR